MIADILVQKNLITLTNVRKLFNSLASFIPALCMIAFYFCDEKQQILGVISVLLFLLSVGKFFCNIIFRRWFCFNYAGLGVGSGYTVNYSDIVPAYSGLVFGLTTTVSSMSGVLGNVIAGILIKHPTLHDWRKLFILFFIVYLIGGIIFLILGSAVPEEWATFKSQEQAQNIAQSQEETLPMKQRKQIEDTETDGTMHVNT
jgi:MFS family permease